MKVKVVNKSQNQLPEYATIGSAGLDLRADLSRIKEKFFDGVAIDEERDVLLIFSGGRCLIPTGLFMQLPEGYEAQIRPRSGLALKQGVTITNSPGTIDSDYTGEVGVVLQNTSNDVFEVKTGDRICQMVINKVEQLEWEQVDSLEDTDRGEGGFGHTGS